MNELLKTLKENSCDCLKCQSMCMRPCWPLPEEAKKIIDAGYGNRMMVDYLVGEKGEDDTYLISPALKGYESKIAPFIPMSQEGCTFFKDGLCELHEKGLKPFEGRMADCSKVNHVLDVEKDLTSHKLIGMEWSNEEAKNIVFEWEEKYQKENEDGCICMTGFNY